MKQDAEKPEFVQQKVHSCLGEIISGDGSNGSTPVAVVQCLVLLVFHSVIEIKYRIC